MQLVGWPRQHLGELVGYLLKISTLEIHLKIRSLSLKSIIIDLLNIRKSEIQYRK